MGAVAASIEQRYTCVRARELASFILGRAAGRQAAEQEERRHLLERREGERVLAWVKKCDEKKSGFCGWVVVIGPIGDLEVCSLLRGLFGV